MEIEYAVSDGTYIINGPTTRSGAEAALALHTQRASETGQDKSYFIVRRRASNLLTDRPTAWESLTEGKS